MVNFTEWEWERYYMVSEESETIIKRDSESKYLSLRRKQVWASFKSHGGEVIWLRKSESYDIFGHRSLNSIFKD